MTAVLSVLLEISLVIIGVGLAGGLLYLGWLLAVDDLDSQRQDLENQRRALDAGWRALDNTRRVREVFLVARRAMQRQADDDQRRGGGTA